MKLKLFGYLTLILLVFGGGPFQRLFANEKGRQASCEGALLSKFKLLKAGSFITAMNMDMASLIAEDRASSFVGEKNWLKSNYVRRLTSELRNYWMWRGQGTGVLVPLVETDRPLKNHYSYVNHERFQRRYEDFLKAHEKPSVRLSFDNVYTLLEIIDKKIGGKILSQESQVAFLFDRAFLAYNSSTLSSHVSNRDGVSVLVLNDENSTDSRIRIYFHFSDSLFLVIEYAPVPAPAKMDTL